MIAGSLAALAASARGMPMKQVDSRESKLIVRNQSPLDAETPVEAFDTFLTPADSFFVRSHFGAPAVGLRPWRIEVSGLVDRKLTLTPDDLAALPHYSLPAVLQCSGNGRAFHIPRVPGLAWERGAVGNAEWGGVRLRDVLERAGLNRDVKHIHFLGADRPPSPKTPAFFRSIPIERALDPATLLAFQMNGAPLPPLHGGPVRLVVPGWAGNHWIKWIKSITAAREEAPGFFMQTGYRLPREPVPPGVDVKPEDTISVTEMNVKSLFSRPANGARFANGPATARGVAWTGGGRVTKVEVSIDGGPWSSAELHGIDQPFAWRLWSYEWSATPGRHKLRARATDSNGQTQPEKTPWNKSGYLWNGIDEIACEVV